MTVEKRDGRLIRFMQRFMYVAVQAGHRHTEWLASSGSLIHFLQVGTGAKRAITNASDDDRSDIGIPIALTEKLNQASRHLVAERIAAFFSVYRDIPYVRANFK